MANRIKIEILANPGNNKIISFEASNSTGFYAFIIKVFIPFGFVPASNAQVAKGVSAYDTLFNLQANLVATSSYPEIAYSFDYPFIYIDFVVQPGDFVLNVIKDAAGAFEITTELVEVPVPEPSTLLPLDLKDISIEIIDTYINERILIEETAAANACLLKFDAGDDLIKTISASQLDFNMLVENFEDAHFLHLFSGDENRFRVEVYAIDANENSQLIWQGFLLPDQYKESYKTAALFVDFTASDMLSALKGAKLQPWYYYNSLPIGELLSLLLGKTGLAQHIIVNPAIVPGTSFFPFNTINIDMRTFIDGAKYKDCYTILEDVLQSLGLTVVNFRGFWMIEGYSKKKKISSTYFQFDPFGKLTTGIIVNKEVKQFFAQAASVDLTALTPFKKVNVEFDKDSDSNLFSKNIVKFPTDEFFKTNYSTGNYSGPAGDNPSPETYVTSKVKDWIPNLNPDFSYERNNIDRLMWRVAKNSGTTYQDYNDSFSQYNYTEAMALANYIECKEQPYIKAGVLYELEMSFELRGMRIYLPNGSDAIERKIKAGDYNRLIPFQLFLNGVEKYSNRPSFVNNVNYSFDVESIGITTKRDFAGAVEVNVVDLRFVLKKKIKFDVSGQLRLRISMPIFRNNISLAYDTIEHESSLSYNCFFYGNVLKMTAVEGIEQNDDLTAKRVINFTQELDYELPITCTPDNGVVNSFGLGFPINPNYFKTIPRDDTFYEINNYHRYAPTTLLKLVVATWKTDYINAEKLFAEGKIKAVFLDQLMGGQVVFDDLWLRSYYPANVRLGYLESFEGYPNIPKDYQAHPGVSTGDILKYMDVQYGAESFANRNNWKVDGTDITGTLPRVMAAMLHGIQPRQIYRLEESALDLIFPMELIQFYFKNIDRLFVPTRLELDLFAGKTKVTATEGVFETLTDIVYE